MHVADIRATARGDRGRRTPAFGNEDGVGIEFTTLAPLGERVDRNRRFHQPGRDG